MSKPEKGMRVGAMMSADEKKMLFLGYGTYVGKEPCPALGNYPNPKIQLDNGDIVWGCECWWDTEDGMKKRLAKYKGVIKDVRIADFRHASPAEGELT